MVLRHGGLMLALGLGAALVGCEPLPLAPVGDHESLTLGGLVAGTGSSGGNPAAPGGSTPAATSAAIVEAAPALVLGARQGDNLALAPLAFGPGQGTTVATANGRQASSWVWSAGSGSQLRQLAWYGTHEALTVAATLDLSAGQLEYVEPGLDVALARTWRSSAGTLRLLQRVSEGAAARWTVVVEGAKLVALAGTAAAGGFTLEATCSVRVTGP